MANFEKLLKAAEWQLENMDEEKDRADEGD
jgi:hypothetical protein